MKEWERVEPTKKSKIGFRQITSKSFILPDGTKQVFDCLNQDDANFTSTIAITTQGKIILARQYRPGPEKVLEELPGGFVDQGESVEDAAVRELLEETGYKPGMIEYIGYHFRSAYLNGRSNVYLMTDCEKVAEQNLEPREFIEIDLISIDQLIENAKNGLLTDGGAVMMAYDRLQQIKSGQK